MKTIFDNIKAIIGLLVVLSVFAMFFIILFRYKDDNNAVSQVIIAAVGSLGGITGYYFGYSSGAAKKDETMTDTVNKLTDKVK